MGGLVDCVFIGKMIVDRTYVSLKDFGGVFIMLNANNQQDRTYLFRHMKVFPDYIQDYFKSKLHSLSPSTLRGYAIDFEDFFEWIIEEGVGEASEIKNVHLSTLENLKAAQIQKDFIHYLNLRDYKGGRKVKGKKLNQRTLNRKISALRALFYWLSSVAKNKDLEPLLKHNPMEYVDLKQEKYNPLDVAGKIRSSILMGKEFYEFYEFVLEGYGELPNIKKMSKRKHVETRERDLAIVSLILEVGLRASEVQNITMDDIVLENKRIKVSRKGGKSIVLDLTKQASGALESYLNIRNERFGPKSDQTSLFLTNQQAPGQTMTKRAIQNMIEKYAEAFGKPLLTAHSMRHSFATRHYAKHEDIDTLKEIMGHSETETTMVYTHVLTNRVKVSTQGSPDSPNNSL